MNAMNEKKLYVWRLATFLRSNDKTMDGDELADHLNRNRFRTAQGTPFEHGRGIYKLIHETFNWINNELELEDEAHKVASAYVQPDGKHAWDK